MSGSFHFLVSDPKTKKLANTTADFGNFITKTKICNEPGNNQTDMMDLFFQEEQFYFRSIYFFFETPTVRPLRPVVLVC